jgi:hypothetical protein
MTMHYFSAIELTADERDLLDKIKLPLPSVHEDAHTDYSVNEETIPLLMKSLLSRAAIPSIGSHISMTPDIVPGA